MVRMSDPFRDPDIAAQARREAAEEEALEAEALEAKAAQNRAREARTMESDATNEGWYARVAEETYRRERNKQREEEAPPRRNRERIVVRPAEVARTALVTLSLVFLFALRHCLLHH
jgi:hypothetical protein